MSFRKSIIAVALTVAGACATTSPPRELTAAQLAYAKASQGPAQQVAPDELHKAKNALDAAEQSYSKDPNSAVTRDLSYIAERKAQLADAKGKIVLGERNKIEADKAYTKTLTGMQKETQAELDATKRGAAEDRAAADARIAAETQARLDAERKADLAMKDLAQIAKMREEERGMVISLSGDILFATDQSILLGSAQAKLNQLADVLNQSNQHLTVEGHTDARGSDSHNQDLSFRRATAVRDYLVSRGVKAERFDVQGYGRTRPIADNNSAEGRANNRRVEIVIEGKHAATAVR